MKKLIIAILLVIAALAIAACGSSAGADDHGWDNWYTAPEAPWDFETDASDDFYFTSGMNGSMNIVGDVGSGRPSYGGADSGQVGWEDIAGANQRHIIQTATMQMETEYFDDTVTALRQLAPQVNGYISQERLTTHGQGMFTIVLRVPAASFDDVIRKIEQLATLRSTNQWAEDVTDQFYDTVGSLEIRLAEEERILELIELAETVHEILALEERLSNTRFMIEWYESRLNDWAGQIAYSTITVTLFCIAEEEYVPLAPTMGERIGGAFGDSVDGTVAAAQGFVVVMAGLVIPVMLLGVVALVIFLLVRSARRKRAV